MITALLKSALPCLFLVPLFNHFVEPVLFSMGQAARGPQAQSVCRRTTVSADFIGVGRSNGGGLGLTDIMVNRDVQFYLSVRPTGFFNSVCRLLILFFAYSLT